MVELRNVKDFGTVDADTDPLLDECFENHEAYLRAQDHSKFLILGRKGSGKTAIYRKILSDQKFCRFSFGHDFTDYPWHLHDHQSLKGVPEEQRFTHSWRYLISLTCAKILLNQDQSQPCSDVALQHLAKLESFVADSYGSRNPDVAQLFSQQRRLHFKASFEWNLGLKAGVNAETIAMADLPTIVQDVNRNLVTAVIESLNPDFDYFVCFDQLDLGFDGTDLYRARLVGLLLAARDFNVRARQAGMRFSVLVFLRDDIYEDLIFEDKNKITENFALRIEWDTSRTNHTLKQLMEKRFAVALSVPECDAWEITFDEREKMTGRQSKYQHMVDRTFLRPRDMIKFCNAVLAAHKQNEKEEPGTQNHFSNKDVQIARPEYSMYLLAELDDEVPKHVPDYKKYIEILKSMDSLQFDRSDFEAACEKRASFLSTEKQPIDILSELFRFSIIGCYAPGGGSGGSEYIFKYKEPSAQFNEAATSFRIHAGLKEVLGVKNYTRSG
jgi:hypothetical protein